MRYVKAILLVWLALCAALTYRQLGHYITLALTQYLPRYFPMLGGLG